MDPGGCGALVGHRRQRLQQRQRQHQKRRVALLLLLALLGGASCRQLTVEDAAAPIQPGPESYSWPHDPVFEDPWVRSNVALAYLHEVQDGIGSQTIRMLGVYALAAALQVQHLARPLRCVGHIGQHPHYREAACHNLTAEADRRLLQKARHMVALPSTVSEQHIASWRKEVVPSLSWKGFVKQVAAARQQQQPVLFEVERTDNLVKTHPDVFFSIPAVRPSQPQAPLACRPWRVDRQTYSPLGAGRPSKSWLLDALRVAVHVRRGDLITGNWFRRVLSARYYIEVARTVAQVLESLGCEYAVEVYIESPTTPEGEEELRMLRDEIPNAVMLVDSDMLWSWQMLASADVVVMSNSMFSVSAALLNPDAVAIHVPNEHMRRVGMFKMRHWLTPMENGTLPRAAVDLIKHRGGYAAVM